jgi:hypothetical protein
MMAHQHNAETTCPECGAPRVQSMACWEQLGGILAWEYTDPDLQAEHFLTVASYNLQHPAQFTDEAIAGLRISLSQRLDHQVTDAEIRRRTARAFEGSARVKRPAAEQHPVLRHWTMTIADVFLPDPPEGAADRVRAWAASIRRDLEA